MSIDHDMSEMNILFVHSSVDDYPLVCEEFRVYGNLARRAKDKKAFPGIKNIAEKCRIHPDTAKDVVRRLEAYGIIRIEQRGAQGLPNLYHLTPRSQWKSEAEVLAIQEAAAEAGKAKRAAKKSKKKAETPTLQTTPPEMEAPPSVSPPRETKSPQGDETKGGEGGETKAPEGNPTRFSIQGNPISLAAPAAEGAPGQVQEHNDPAQSKAGEGGTHTPAQVQVPANAQPGNATNTGNVPPAAPRVRPSDFQRLVDAWNEHRGTLPAVQEINEGRKKAMKSLLRDCGGDADKAVGLLTDAAREVAQDPYYQERRYGFDNVVPSKVLGRAEAWRSRNPSTPAATGTPGKLRPSDFQVGQRVTFKGYGYTVEATSDASVILNDDINGRTFVRVNSNEWHGLKLPGGIA